MVIYGNVWSCMVAIMQSTFCKHVQLLCLTYSIEHDKPGDILPVNVPPQATLAGPGSVLPSSSETVSVETVLKN